MIPPKPAVFAADVAPPGVEYRHVEFARPKLTAPARRLVTEVEGPCLTISRMTTRPEKTTSPRTDGFDLAA